MYNMSSCIELTEGIWLNVNILYLHIIIVFYIRNIEIVIVQKY